MKEQIKEYVANLRQEWQPRTKIVTGVSPKDFNEEISFTRYHNEHTSVWTDEETAFMGFVFQHIKELIQES